MTILREDAPADDLLVVEVDADDGLEGSASGHLAAALVAAFGAARDGVSSLGPDGCVIFAVRGGEAAQAGVAALTRSLALEWAPRGIRVNAVGGDPVPDLIRFLASPASRMLTGAVLET